MAELLYCIALDNKFTATGTKQQDKHKRKGWPLTLGSRQVLLFAFKVSFLELLLFLYSFYI